MESTTTLEYGRESKGKTRVSFVVGWILTILITLFMLFDGISKLFKPDWVVKPTVELGFSEGVIVPLGIVVTICTIFYIIPRTAVLGAILLTGWLGGAVAINVFTKQPWGFIFLPAIMGALAWLALVLRDARVRAVVPFK